MVNLYRRDFEDKLAGECSQSPKEWRDALVGVADTAYMCISWFKDQDIKFTAADLMTMTGLVMKKEQHKLDYDLAREQFDLERFFKETGTVLHE